MENDDILFRNPEGTGAVRLNPIIFGWSLVFLGFMWGPLLIKYKMKREQLTFLRHEQHLAYFVLIHLPKATVARRSLLGCSIFGFHGAERVREDGPMRWTTESCRGRGSTRDAWAA